MLTCKNLVVGLTLLANCLCFETTKAQSQKVEFEAKPEVQSLLNQAVTLSQSQKFEAAIAKGREAVKLAEKLKDSYGLGQSYQSIGVDFYRSGDGAQALENFLKARPIFATLGASKAEASVLSNIGLICSQLGKTDEARRAYLDAMAIHTQAGSAQGVARTNLNLAMLFDSSDPTKCLEYSQKALDGYTKLGDTQWVSITLTVVGGANSKLGNSQRAVDCFATAANVAQKDGNSSLESDALSMLGDEYDALGQYSWAIDAYEKSLVAAKNAKDKRQESQALSNLGIVYNKVGQRRVAQDYFKQTIDITKKTGDEGSLASAMQNLGVSLNEDGSLEQAKSWIEKALDINRKRGVKTGEAGCLGVLGDMARQEKKFDEAAELLTKSAALFKQAGQEESEATAYDSLGSVLLEQGNAEASLVQYDKAITIYDSIRSVSFAATSYGNKAEAYYRLRRLQDAEKCCQAAISRYEFVRSGLGVLTDAKGSYLKQRVHVYQQYANVLTLLGKADEAFDVAQKTKARGLLDLLASGRLVVDADMTVDEKKQERELKSRADILNAKMVQQGVENEVGAKARYAALADELKKAEDELSKFTTNLYARHPGLALKRAAETATAEEFAKVLPDDTAVVDFVVCEDEVVSLVLRKVNGVLTINGHSRTYDVDDLKRRCGEFRSSCSNPKGDYKSWAMDLYQNLFSAISKDIEGKSRLIICPDACLWDLPFAALMPTADTFLVDKFEIDYAYSATGVLAALKGQRAKTSPTKQMLVCANPDFGSSNRFQELVTREGQRPIDTPSRPIDQPSRPIDQPSRPIDQPSRPIDQPSRPIDQPSRPIDRPSRPIDQPSRALDSVSRALDSVSRSLSEGFGRGSSIVPLPGTQREADALKDMFPGATLLTGKDAQESRLKKEAENYRYIHLATHGFVNDASPLLSSIVLAEPEKGSDEDGFLTAREIHGLGLNAEMVVLSACNTARGEIRSGEGIVGLTWALFVAGCPCQVVSQWSVDDVSTAQLMTDFYSQIKKTGRSKGDALKVASENLRKDEKYRHPYYWAPFILIGDWR